MHLIYCLLLIMPIALLSESINLEHSLCDDLVVSTKRIEIPGIPDAFNPSVIRWKNKLLMTFRFIPDIRSRYTTYTGAIFLDSEFNPIGEPIVLTLRDSKSQVPSRAEDARLIKVGSKLYIIYSDNPNLKITRGGYRVHIAELSLDGEKIKVLKIDCFTKFEGEDQNLREKNWVPFTYKDTLLLSYSLSPHTIFKPFIGLSECKTFCSTKTNVSWDYGILRGGTPAALVENEYLAFFHSSIPMQTIHSFDKPSLHYFMGAYTFSAVPPFEIKRISKKPIVGKNFYSGISYKPYWHPVKAIFPGGYLVNQNSIFVFYGRDDHEIWVATIDKKKLLSNLVKTSNGENDF